MSVSAPASDPNLEDFLRHGGRLAAARRAFPDAPTPWLDLSTGINPRPWKGARATAASLTRLPDPDEIKTLEAAAAADDDVAYGHGDSVFHEAFFSQSGNPYVVNSYALVSGKIAALRTNMARQFSNARDVSLQEHRAMVACVDAGDFAQLAAILQAHVGRTVEAFRLASAAALDAAAAAPTLRLRSTD